MGVHAMVKAALSGIKSTNSTNPRYFAKVDRRFSSVAHKVEASGDVTEQQKLEEVVQTIAKQLVEVTADASGDLSGQLAPRVYERVKEILSGADRMLDAFQPPPEDHAKVMEAAMSKDRKALGSLLDQLSQADDKTLESAHEMGRNLPKPPLTPPPSRGATQLRRESTLSVIQEQTLERKSSQASTSTISRTSTIRNEERAHAQFVEKLEAHKMGKREPSIIIGISAMGLDDSESTTTHFVPLEETFCGLADTFMDLGDEDFLPDFWSKELNPTHNRVTPSGMWFEWQDPSKKVMDAITKKGHLGIETVCKDGEYVVALVKNGERENGMPIDIPRARRLPASQHFQQIFPGHIIPQIRRLENGDDASKVVFDSRSFRHQTAPLFVELSHE